MKRQRPRRVSAWAIVDPDGDICLLTIGPARAATIDRLTSDSADWRTWRAEGFRCVRITICWDRP
jgi:hypothetical protein